MKTAKQSIPSETVIMAVETFETAYHFILSDPQKETIRTAREQGRPIEVTFIYVLGMRYIHDMKVADPLNITVMETVRESLPNYTPNWCDCKAETEWDVRFMDDDSCSCGIRKHHVHRNACGHVTQVG